MTLDELITSMPFTGRTGITLDTADPAEVRGRLAWAPELCTVGGVLHGGEQRPVATVTQTQAVLAAG